MRDLYNHFATELPVTRWRQAIKRRRARLYIIIIIEGISALALVVRVHAEKGTRRGRGFIATAMPSEEKK